VSEALLRASDSGASPTTQSLAHRSRSETFLTRRTRIALACAEGRENDIVARGAAGAWSRPRCCSPNHLLRLDWLPGQQSIPTDFYHGFASCEPIFLRVVTTELLLVESYAMVDDVEPAR